MRLWRVSGEVVESEGVEEWWVYSLTRIIIGHPSSVGSCACLPCLISVRAPQSAALSRGDDSC